MKKMLAWLREPSLMRRSAGALGLAFVLVLLALLAHDYLETRQAYVQDLAIHNRATLLAPELAGLADVAEAGRLMTSLARINESWRARTGQARGPVIHQLRDAAGTVRAAYPPERADAFAAGPAPVTQGLVRGVTHWIATEPAGPWTLVIAEPAEPLAPLLWRLADDILDKLLLALPLVLLPMGIALWTGLAPLRRLTQALAARDPQDLSPLGVAPPHRELRPLADAFERLLARLRQRVERERRFVQDAAHELRTPITALALQLENLRQDVCDGAAAARFAQLEAGVRRAQRLVDQLLRLSRQEAAGADGAAIVDVQAQLRESVNTLIALADQRNIDLGLIGPPLSSAPLTLRCVPGDLRSLLDNLIENALRYTPEGGVVDVRLLQEGGRMAVEVVDTGPGIPQELLPRVFDRFFRVPGTQAGGSGLGLAIAHSAAQRCGVELTLRNRADRSGLIARLEAVG
jgi:signal transduction histidine kinase